MALTKPLGSVVTAKAVVQNNTQQVRYASLDLFVTFYGIRAWVIGTGPVPIPGGSRGTLGGSSGPFTNPGTFPYEVFLYEVDSSGVQQISQLFAGTDSIVIPDLPPPVPVTRDQVIQKAQQLAGTTGTEVDTRYFIGLALLEFRVLVQTATRDYIVGLSATAGWTWQQSLDWWVTSGNIIPGMLT